jgi:hypothetical protein
VTGRQSVRWTVLPAATLFALVPSAGCDRGVDGVPSAADAVATPATADDLGRLLVTSVPSGLPRLPDEHLEPPAGRKTVADVAAYADDPARERNVLEDYGYSFGWERFWGEGGALTGVYVHKHEHRAGADAYTRDLASNEAELYSGVLSENPPDLPGGCWLLTVEDPQPAVGLTGPAAIAWCGIGVFSVSVSAVAGSVEAATEEVRLLVPLQLDRLRNG